MGERFQAIKAGLERAMGLKKFHGEAMENKQSMPAHKSAPEKPANVVELTQEQVEEANNLAENGYQDKAEEENKKAA